MLTGLLYNFQLPSHCAGKNGYQGVVRGGEGVSEKVGGGGGGKGVCQNLGVVGRWVHGKGRQGGWGSKSELCEVKRFKILNFSFFVYRDMYSFQYIT